MIDEKIKKILEQFKINPAKALWDCHGTQIMYHRYIEEIGASAGVQVIKYETITIIFIINFFWWEDTRYST